MHRNKDIMNYYSLSDADDGIGGNKEEYHMKSKGGDNNDTTIKRIATYKTEKNENVI